MIRVQNLSYGFPDKELYNDISFEIAEGTHCVLIGSNGSGKTTLVELLHDPESYIYDGKIILEEQSKTGYVHQFYPRDSEQDTTVFEFLSENFLQQQNRLMEICEEMSSDNAPEDIFDIYQKQLDEIQASDGDNYESNIKKQLKESSLTHLENHHLHEISGGEYKLLQIIKEMLKKPNLLIMDEPDVFLDFENLHGLRKLINSYEGTLLVITHNRYLLNYCFNKVLHLEGTDLQEFDGKFQEYRLALFLKKIELLEKSEVCRKEIERTEKMVERMRDKATKADIASLGRVLNAKQTYLDRLKDRAIKPPFVDLRRPDIMFPEIMDSGEEVLVEIEDYHLSFDKVLLEKIDFQLHKGEKVAIVGSNGTGKSTFLTEIFMKENLKVRYHQDCKIGFLSQEQKEIGEAGQTVCHILEESGLDKEEDMLLWLDRYCLHKEVLNKKADTLSGGEKNLLQLIKIALSGANLLLLDEPTSHLDAFSQIELENAIKNYQGAVIIVSHDFYNIVNCADYILLVENNRLRKMRMRSFRKMMYDTYFSSEYIAQEEKKKELETRISECLRDGKIQKATDLCEQLGELIK